MNQEADEQLVADYFFKYQLDFKRFTEEERQQLGKTPDWKAMKDGELAFYCEVKTVRLDTWLDDRLAEAPPGTLVGGLRKDPTYNRLTDDIHTAFKQFNSVDPDHQVPNVLAFVNHEKHCGYVDLYGVLTGQFPADNGRTYYIFGKYSEGRMIREQKKFIDLYIWLNADNPKDQWHFAKQNELHHQRLLEFLHQDPSEIKTVPCGFRKF